MQAKYNFFVQNKTQELTLMPENRQVIIGQQYFKLKKDYNNQILKYNARQIAHNFKQEENVNFIETFATVVKPISYKCLFKVSIKRIYKI